ncbi:uncharacterized protein LY79DRAFT_316494 [Colletotrichum navitas]|uniref:Uncharacterized protein n=1 Tax=Colletotrichum navitas TaxID=681940 RepID=A0AAD8PU94_9PEZI|nr:uncharacterized protein LY79DRAFT_316494 [Colletotrichum navitas]KAK1580153.1 hypothetical protein LY79DRAFT_316494 [Colletotrichum navitas]
MSRLDGEGRREWRGGERRGEQRPGPTNLRILDQPYCSIPPASRTKILDWPFPFFPPMRLESDQDQPIQSVSVRGAICRRESVSVALQDENIESCCWCTVYGYIACRYFYSVPYEDGWIALGVRWQRPPRIHHMMPTVPHSWTSNPPPIACSSVLAAGWSLILNLKLNSASSLTIVKCSH